MFKPLYKHHRHLDRKDLPDSVFNLDQDCAYSGPYTISGSNGQYQVLELPGLEYHPTALSPDVQNELITDIIEVYVPDPQHLSNLTPHYILPRPFRLFDDCAVESKIPGKQHTTMQRIRDSQLRWITLGGQYNWTEKVYPSFDSWPEFPHKLAGLVSSTFPGCPRPQAAIVNFYSPGDILSPHQDVAERSSRDLVSLSIGCECIFYVGMDHDQEPLQILLRSGDAVVMGNDARFAFHGVGRVFDHTSPAYLHAYGEWMAHKRVNINVRQMVD